MSKAISVQDTDHWHALRARHVGSSECAALFGESPYLTAFELFHQKLGTLPRPDLSGDDRVMFGQLLEPAIAEAVRRKTGWMIKKVHRYYSMMPELRAGASLDFEILNHPNGPGLLECKTADWLVAKGWGDQKPLAYELQIQHALMACGRSWGCMAVLIGGNSLEIVTYDARPRTMEIIRQRVAEFWRRVEEGRPPPADYMVDADTVMQLHRAVEAGKTIDLSGNNRLPELCAEYQRAAAAKGVEDKARKAAQAEILTLIGDAETVICGDLTIKAAEVRGVPDRIISQADVGTVIKGRSGFRGLHVSKRKVLAA